MNTGYPFSLSFQPETAKKKKTEWKYMSKQTEEYMKVSKRKTQDTSHLRWGFDAHKMLSLPFRLWTKSLSASAIIILENT